TTLHSKLAEARAQVEREILRGCEARGVVLDIAKYLGLDLAEDPVNGETLDEQNMRRVLNEVHRQLTFRRDEANEYEWMLGQCREESEAEIKRLEDDKNHLEGQVAELEEQVRETRAEKHDTDCDERASEYWGEA